MVVAMMIMTSTECRCRVLLIAQFVEDGGRVGGVVVKAW